MAAPTGFNADTFTMDGTQITKLRNGNMAVYAQFGEDAYLSKPYLIPLERSADYAAMNAIAAPAPLGFDGYKVCGPVKAAYVYQVQSIPAGGTVPAWNVAKACRFAMMREIMYGCVGTTNSMTRSFDAGAAGAVGEFHFKPEECLDAYVENMSGNDAALGDGAAYNFNANHNLMADNSGRLDVYRAEFQAIIAHASFRKAKRVVVATVIMNGSCLVTGRHHIDRTSSYFKEYKKVVIAKDYDVDLFAGFTDKEDAVCHKSGHGFKEMYLMDISVHPNAKTALQSVNLLTLADRLPPKVPNSGAIYTGLAMLDAFGASVIACLTLPVLDSEGQIQKDKAVDADGKVSEKIVRHFTQDEATKIVDGIKNWFATNKRILDENIIRYSQERALQAILESVTQRASKILAFSAGLAEGARITHSTVDESAYRANKAKTESPASFLSGIQLGKRLKSAPVDATTVIGIFTVDKEFLPGANLVGANEQGFTTTACAVAGLNQVTVNTDA